MVFPKHSIYITETETEFLLSIHASQKDRAKKIVGCRWVPDQRCWVYPKTARVYDALIEEFSDDLVGDLTIIRPGKLLETKTEHIEVEAKDIKQEVEKIHKTLELISGVKSEAKESETIILQRDLARKENELTKIRYRVQELERHLEEQRVNNQELNIAFKQLQETNQALKLNLESQSSQVSVADYKQWIREKAKDAAGGNKKFCLLVDRLHFNHSLPIDLVVEMEKELRRVLKCHDRSITLYDLLIQSNNEGILTSKELDLAHSIRKQRNLLAHEVIEKETLVARLLFCLFAAALLWSEFPE